VSLRKARRDYLSLSASVTAATEHGTTGIIIVSRSPISGTSSRDRARAARTIGKIYRPAKEAWLRLRIFYLADVSGEASSRPDKTELLGGHSRSKRSNMIVAIHPAVGAVSCLANV
jgi:hypothetical protein